jgi:anaerobic magnesium-protoporphyrin IX monomethyl ester cyclase
MSAVLLINPRMSPRQKARLPLSLLHLAAVLEGERPWQIVDGNVDDDLVGSVLAALAARPHALVGVSVMPGPQVAPAIEVSAAIRARYPELPIVWGGYFPTLYPDAAINAPYVDYVVRGQGEQALVELLRSLEQGGPIAEVKGLTWKQGGVPVHNLDAPLIPPHALPALPYEGLAAIPPFLPPSFLGRRTAVHQAALGCRYKCEFCGVVSMWNGKTLLEAPDRLLASGTALRDRWGADALQFYDHNFFDREDTSTPILEVLERLGLPWWCYARADTLANFSTATWERIRRSRLRMTYVGAEAASDAALARMRKGTKVEHTLELAKLCRAHGVIPELSFILGGPDDPEGEVEKTFSFIRRVKRLNPDAEIVLYFYSPTPQRDRLDGAPRPAGPRLPVLRSYGPSGPTLPTTPEEWTEPRWVSWVCHQDAPWVTPRLRQRIKDFARVLSCRFPTVQDHRTPDWGKSVLRNLARWRYQTERYARPWELELAQRLIPLADPKVDSL